MLSGQAFSQMGEESSLLTQLEDGGQRQEQDMQQPVSPAEQNEQIEQFVSGVQQANV
ncbi:MAG: hypothetical protein Q4B28_00795 [bacterium]|nr:hypothetical protein [bacterium]